MRPTVYSSVPKIDIPGQLKDSESAPCIHEPLGHDRQITVSNATARELEHLALAGRRAVGAITHEGIQVGCLKGRVSAWCWALVYDYSQHRSVSQRVGMHGIRYKSARRHRGDAIETDKPAQALALGRVSTSPRNGKFVKRSASVALGKAKSEIWPRVSVPVLRECSPLMACG